MSGKDVLGTEWRDFFSLKPAKIKIIEVLHLIPINPELSADKYVLTGKYCSDKSESEWAVCITDSITNLKPVFSFFRSLIAAHEYMDLIVNCHKGRYKEGEFWMEKEGEF